MNTPLLNNPKIVLTPEDQRQLEGAVRREFPGTDVLRAVVYEKQGQPQLHLRLGGDPVAAKTVLPSIVVNADNHAELYNTVLPAIQAAKAKAVAMRNAASEGDKRPGTPPDAGEVLDG